jgi:hypothetical protein
MSRATTDFAWEHIPGRHVREVYIFILPSGTYKFFSRGHANIFPVLMERYGVTALSARDGVHRPPRSSKMA